MRGNLVSETQDDGRVEEPPVRDLYLHMLIKLLEKDETNRSDIPVTLTTNGTVVYGKLIAMEAWKQLWPESLRDAQGTGADVVRDFLETIDTAFKMLREEEGLPEPEDDGLRNFVHLKDAVVLAPGTDGLRTPLWRGRLDSITGWSLGTP